MIRVDKLMLDIRYKIKDTSKITFTDYELLSAINSCLSLINDELVSAKANLVVKKYIIEATDNNMDAFPLPDDFYIVKDLYDPEAGTKYTPNVNILPKKQYEIIGNMLYLDNPYKGYNSDEEPITKTPIVLEYYYEFPEILAFNETIDLPRYFAEVLKNMAVLYIKMGVTYDQQILNDLRSLIAMNINVREQNDIDRALPFYR